MPGSAKSANSIVRVAGRSTFIAGLAWFCISGCGSVDSDTLSPPNQGSNVSNPPPNNNGGAVPPSGTTNKPSLSFKIEPVYCCNPNTRYFEARVDNITVRGTVAFTWDFGDGRTGSGPALEHTYSWPGEYTVALEARLPDDTVLLSEQSLSFSGVAPPPPDDDDSPDDDPIVDGPMPDDGDDPTDEPQDPDDEVVDGENPEEEPTDPDDEPVDSDVNLEAIEQVRTGVLTTADASWWGFDAADATAAIQNAINSRATTIVIPNMGQDWVVRPLFLASNKEIVFEPGVVLAAKPGAFRGLHDAMFTADKVTHVTLRGTNGVLRMRKADYTSSDYSVSEWRHVLRLKGVNHVDIEGLSFQSSGGDGIYIGPSEDSHRLPSRNVTIRNCDCYNNHRQGMSVLSAENLLVDNCTFRNTIGTAPQAAVDLEPVDWKDALVNVQFTNCSSIGNAGSGFMANLSYMVPTSRPVSVTVSNLLVQNSRQPGLRALIVEGGPPGGFIEFRDCVVENTEYAGFSTKWHLATAIELRFVNVEWRRVARLPDQPPLYFEFMGSGAASLPGGIRFDNCRVIDAQARDTIEISDHQVVSGTPDVTGTIYVNNDLIDIPVPAAGFQLPDLNVVLNPGSP